MLGIPLLAPQTKDRNSHTNHTVKTFPYLMNHATTASQVEFDVPARVQLPADEEDGPGEIGNGQTEKLQSLSARDIARTIFLCLILLLGTATASYTLWKIRSYDESRASAAAAIRSDELRGLIRAIIDEDGNFIGDRERANYAAEVQVLDKEHRVLWSRDLDGDGLRQLLEVQEDTSAGDEDENEG